ncbi:DUF397 domain-containing protein [Saccharopolyspora phatthalungensis]|uniref:ABC-type amino acid transport substrate-binding protein n=1 Tax=Saccharopolyspora phatthalungensis TaxID=664693 RepID=A0A840Q9Y4_9PSEU|nr:DUF397 domain-containing protein [Saccharopolyspora phatthalungensis]MBB5155468.1 ABC-type amino acid transport substrate-binding protein [Saccharopolyspora phatthalungensis]
MKNPDLAQVPWRKSSRSSGGASNCVEVGLATEVVGVRDTKDRDGGTLVFDRSTWDAFLPGLKAGRFDF